MMARERLRYARDLTVMLGIPHRHAPTPVQLPNDEAHVSDLVYSKVALQYYTIGLGEETFVRAVCPCDTGLSPDRMGCVGCTYIINKLYCCFLCEARFLNDSQAASDHAASHAIMNTPFNEVQKKECEYRLIEILNKQQRDYQAKFTRAIDPQGVNQLLTQWNSAHIQINPYDLRPWGPPPY